MKQPRTQVERSTSKSESADLKAATMGDREAFDRLVLRHQERVFDLAFSCLRNHEDALDVTQEVFLKAFLGLKTFRGDAAFATWLFRITMNAIASFRLRRSARKRSAKIISLSAALRSGEDRSDAVDPADSHPECSPATRLARRELRDALAGAIAELDEPYQKVIVLRDVLGESYEDMASTLSAKLGTIKSQLFRARQSVRQSLAAHV